MSNLDSLSDCVCYIFRLVLRGQRIDHVQEYRQIDVVKQQDDLTHMRRRSIAIAVRQRLLFGRLPNCLQQRFEFIIEPAEFIDFLALALQFHQGLLDDLIFPMGQFSRAIIGERELARRRAFEFERDRPDLFFIQAQHRQESAVAFAHRKFIIDKNGYALTELIDAVGDRLNIALIVRARVLRIELEPFDESAPFFRAGAAFFFT